MPWLTGSESAARSVRLVTGARTRVKVVEIRDPPADLAERLSSAP